MTQADLPPRVPPKVKAAPKPRQVYWCDLPKDAQLPEFLEAPPRGNSVHKGKIAWLRFGCAFILKGPA